VRVPVTDLVGNPGRTRPFTAAVGRDAFGDDPWGPADDALIDPIELDLHLDAVVEGILVRGDLAVRLVLPCARCLAPQPADRTLVVAELFQDPTKRDDADEAEDPGYELIDDRSAIDLSTMVRDAVVIDLPPRVLCRDDCLGLCPECGVDRNEVDCGHGREQLRDPRWDKLAELDLGTDT
jgi:uncharacterized protein